VWKRGKHTPCTELLREVIRYVGRALSAADAVGAAESDPGSKVVKDVQRVLWDSVTFVACPGLDSFFSNLKNEALAEVLEA